MSSIARFFFVGADEVDEDRPGDRPTDFSNAADAWRSEMMLSGGADS